MEIWPDQPAKAAQKDVDARWTVKHSRAKPVTEGEKAKPDIAIPVFGYKNHIGIDRRYGHPYLAGERCSSPRWRWLREGLSNFASDVWAIPYRSGENERYLKAIGKVRSTARSPRANRCLGAPQGRTQRNQR